MKIFKRKKRKTFEELCKEVLNEFGILEFEYNDFYIEYKKCGFPITFQTFYKFKCTYKKVCYISEIYIDSEHLNEEITKKMIREVIGGCLNETN